MVDHWSKSDKTVRAKVIDVSKKEKRFCVTLVIRDVGINPSFSVKSLRKTVKEKKKIIKIFKETKYLHNSF